jgi:tetratricopeptide (TPR) repeat protein
MEDTASQIATAERYERGLTLKKAGYYKSAIAQFEQAATDTAYALRAYAQIGLCNKAVGRHEEAVAAFRKALSLGGISKRDTVQLLYVLGRTLEGLGRITETLEAYRWIRREDPGYRDVADRIEQLSSQRAKPTGKSSLFSSLLRTSEAVKTAPKSSALPK